MIHRVLRQKELLESGTKISSCSDKISINKAVDGETLSTLVPLVLGFPFSFVKLTKTELLPAAL